MEALKLLLQLLIKVESAALDFISDRPAHMRKRNYLTIDNARLKHQKCKKMQGWHANKYANKVGIMQGQHIGKVHAVLEPLLSYRCLNRSRNEERKKNGTFAIAPFCLVRARFTQSEYPWQLHYIACAHALQQQARSLVTHAHTREIPFIQVYINACT